MNDSFEVPHIIAVKHRKLLPLESHLLEHKTQIEAWFRHQFQLTPPPFYASVDIRNAEFKIAPVDTNLFPAGFNNLNPLFLPLAIQACQVAIEQQFPGCIKILLIPESHTRNPFYFENVWMLKEIIAKAGFEVKIGSLQEDLNEPRWIELKSKEKFLLEPITRKDNRIVVGDFNPCLIVLNNDLSSNIPGILKDLEQPILPSLSMGWTTRTKTSHFMHYAQVSEIFSEFIGIDPWLIAPLFTHCQSVNFMTRHGENCLIEKTTELLETVQLKYEQYKIEKPPFIVIKADSGTYGIGVMMIDDPTKLATLGRKARKEMAVTKGGKKLSRVIIQEGIYTHETYGEENFSAEPVVYMMGRHVIGGFYRIHPERGNNQNLNSPGMKFIPLAFSESCNNPSDRLLPRDCPNRFYAYGVIARLALLAAAREMASHD